MAMAMSGTMSRRTHDLGRDASIASSESNRAEVDAIDVLISNCQWSPCVRVGNDQNGEHPHACGFQGPELYDLAEALPDETDASGQYPMRTLDMMSELVRSPMFVGAYDEVLEGRAGE